MKILHTADWHLDSPLTGHGPALRQALASVPGQIFDICRQEACDLVLIAGDVFDGEYTPHTYQNLYDLFKSIEVPVFIAPGNHDFCDTQSPWNKEIWPENVHIFKSQQIESVVIPELDLRVYGAGFAGMDCPSLLENFHADCEQTYKIGLFHGDPTQATSAYNPITGAQVQESGLDYIALGHIHKADSFVAGETLCAWPGCPMGRGYDEQGQKGVYILDLGEKEELRFCPLNTPRFYDLEAAPDDLANILPPVESGDFYRVTLVGSCEEPSLESLRATFAHLSNLILRDQTTRPVDIWGSLGEDNFEGVYFGLLKKMLEEATEEEQKEILLAARLSRALLEGQEVILP